MLGRCDPPTHSWEWTGEGDVRCHCGETTAQLTYGGDGNGFEARLVAPNERPLFGKTTGLPHGDLALTVEVRPDDWPT